MTEMIVVICSGLSIFGQTVILGCFVFFPKLRSGLFARIIVYLTISSLVQTFGILFSSTDYKSCGAFAILRLLGGLCCILWSSVLMYCVRQLFQVLNMDGSMQDLKDEIHALHNREYQFLGFCYGLPCLLIVWPIMTATLDEGKDESFCYIYADESRTLGQHVQIDLQKLLFWEIPIVLYFTYSVIVLNKMKRLFKPEDDQFINADLTHLIKFLVQFPIITLVCTFFFTIEDFIAILGFQSPTLLTFVSYIFLSFWGFLNCIAYLSQDVVKEQLLHALKPEKHQEQKISEVLLCEEDENNRLSIGSHYYYTEDGGGRPSIVERQIQLIDNNQSY